MVKLSYHTVKHVIEALKIEYHRLIKAHDLLNYDTIQIRLNDIKSDLVVLGHLLDEYEKGVNRGKTIIKGISK